MKQVKGIYLIERIGGDYSIDNKRFYIGLAIDLFDRWHQHCVNTDQYIDKMIRKYGVTNFTFRILETTSAQRNLKELESKWINKYKALYGEELLYNLSETSNINPTRIDTEVKDAIEKLFMEDIARSIYAIAERFTIPWKEVVKIRIPLLRKNGLKYDRTTKNVVSLATKQVPLDWRGAQLTSKQVSTILKSIEKGIDIDKDLVSKADLEIYLTCTDNGRLPYECAPEIK